MKINKVTEPKYSSNQLKEFEEKYGFSSESVSYTHLTLPTKRIV